MVKKFLTIIILVFTGFVSCYIQADEQKQKFIPVIVKDTSAIYWQTVYKGSLDSAKKNNIKTAILGMPAETEVQGQISVLENVYTNKPSAILLSPVDKSALSNSINEINPKVPVVLIDSAADTDNYHSFIATDNKEGGKLAAKTMAKFFKEKFGEESGKVAIITGQFGASSLDLRVEGFIEELTKNYPKMEIVTNPPKNANSDLGTALNLMTDLITSVPDLKGVFTNAELSSVGVGQAIAEANKQDKIIGIGFDNNPQTINFVRKGVLKALMAQNPYKIGYEGMETAIKVVNGEKVPKYIDTGVFAVTKDNVDNADVQKILNPLGENNK